ncbi:MAG: alanine--glyoxylate aminotransferase family protein, partial [Ghiorsea sp.]|nr:alanine--glyoxylate aminotransferase family protein [Ghiorsea sp.]
GGGLGVMAGKVWRIVLMGYASRQDNVLKCVSALGEVLGRVGANVDTKKAMAATIAAYGE